MLKREENIRRGEESLQAMQKKLDELQKDLILKMASLQALEEQTNWRISKSILTKEEQISYPENRL